MVHLKSHTALLVIVLASLSGSFGPCDESFPTYQEPKKIFEGKIEGAYVLTASDNSMKVYLTVRTFSMKRFKIERFSAEASSLSLHAIQVYKKVLLLIHRISSLGCGMIEEQTYLP